jgi:hypothetical protein
VRPRDHFTATRAYCMMLFPHAFCHLAGQLDMSRNPSRLSRTEDSSVNLQIVNQNLSASLSPFCSTKLTNRSVHVRRSEGMVVVRLHDHFTATRAYCSPNIFFECIPWDHTMPCFRPSHPWRRPISSRRHQVSPNMQRSKTHHTMSGIDRQKTEFLSIVGQF